MTPFESEELRNELIPSLACAFTELRLIQRDWLQLLPLLDRSDTEDATRTEIFAALRRLAAEAGSAIESAAVSLGASFSASDVYPDAG